MINNTKKVCECGSIIQLRGPTRCNKCITNDKQAHAKRMEKLNDPVMKEHLRDISINWILNNKEQYEAMQQRNGKLSQYNMDQELYDKTMQEREQKRIEYEQYKLQKRLQKQEEKAKEKFIKKQQRDQYKKEQLRIFNENKLKAIEQARQDILNEYTQQELDNEQWKIIGGDYAVYSVSTLGRVRNNKTQRIMKCKINKGTHGYVHVGLINNTTKKQKVFLVHRLIAQVFIPNPDNKPIVNHINHIRHDNRLINLEWATNSENVKAAIEHYSTLSDVSR